MRQAVVGTGRRCTRRPQLAAHNALLHADRNSADLEGAVKLEEHELELRDGSGTQAVAAALAARADATLAAVDLQSAV